MQYKMNYITHIHDFIVCYNMNPFKKIDVNKPQKGMTETVFIYDVI